MDSTELRFYQPSFSELERRYLLQALEGRYWGGGEWVARLEEALRLFYGREAVVVSSGTAALHIALTLLLGEAGGEVIVPTWTFTATASEIVHAGGVPVLADVDENLHLSPQTVEPLISPRTRGIIVMHYAGAPAPLKDLLDLCKRYNLWLLEDACHAIPSLYEGQLCGKFGTAAALSFHATKPIASGQGGAILFSDPELAKKARQLRQHGIRRNLEAPWDYEVETLGWNYMLSDFQAAVALAQLERLPETHQKRQNIARLYTSALQDLSHIRPYPFERFQSVSWHLYPVFWKGASAEQRDKLLRELRQKGIQLSLHYKPLHRHKAYSPYLRPTQRFPQAEHAYNEIFSLPLWADMTEEQAYKVIEALRIAIPA
ncbi:MAG: DegT/DnrJ/EryC1/StrS family aminotransferase [Bacteroidia bacterium]|nr:DegT/DnrJ/EryC1/StrS family aminotransferase [Bacteroidia bacterium]